MSKISFTPEQYGSASQEAMANINKEILILAEHLYHKYLLYSDIHLEGAVFSPSRFLELHKFKHLNENEKNKWGNFSKLVIANRENLFYKKIPFYTSRQRRLSKFLKRNFNYFFSEKNHTDVSWITVACSIIANKEILIPKLNKYTKVLD